VSLSLSSISLRLISVEWSGDGIVIDPTPDDMLSAEMGAIYGKKSRTCNFECGRQRERVSLNNRETWTRFQTGTAATKI
jgi:hypothetical protein